MKNGQQPPTESRRKRKGKKPPITESLIKEWKDLRSEGQTYKEIGRIYGMSKDTISKHLHRVEGTEPQRREKASPQEIASWIAEYKEKSEVTGSQLARTSASGKSVTTICRHLRRAGLPPKQAGRRRKSDGEIIDKQTNPPCWLWRGAMTKEGEGIIRRKGDRSRIASHLLLEKERGITVPKRSQVHRHCGNKLCVNPAHLWVEEPKGRGMNRDTRKPVPLFSEEDVRKIKRALQEEGISVKDVARERDTCTDHIESILSGEYWQHITP